MSIENLQSIYGQGYRFDQFVLIFPIIIMFHKR